MKKLIPLALIALLTACENAPQAYHAPALSFTTTQAAPIRMNVAKIDVINHYQPPYKRPNVEQEFPVAPAKAVEQWVVHRMESTGSSGTLEITIHTASAIETPLKKTAGVKGLFTDDQDARYDTKIAVTFRLLDSTSTASRATADVEVTRFITINEKATVYERERIYHQMLDKLMVDFDREAQQRLRQYFSAYMR